MLKKMFIDPLLENQWVVEKYNTYQVNMYKKFHPLDTISIEFDQQKNLYLLSVPILYKNCIIKSKFNLFLKFNDYLELVNYLQYYLKQYLTY
tara:strand:- start:367 stop:642 length:276 start_codon:yes stop_codon:yes gene_type:complete